MHLNKLSKKVKVIVAGLLAVATVGGLFGYGHNKIKSLEYQLQTKQYYEQTSSGVSHTQMSAKDVKDELNKLHDYSILKDNKVNMKHTYEYQADSILGLKKKAKLTATGTIVYDVDVRLTNATVYYDMNGRLIVKLDEPFVDNESIHMDRSTYHVIKDESNILCNEKDGANVVNYWNNSFIQNATQKINDHYKGEYERNKINDLAKKQVSDLLRTLEIKDFKVMIRGE
mgnify:CR=1 FL=1